MATKIEAARLLTSMAAQRKDAGARTDVESGMAKLFATEACMEVVNESMRIHGGYGFSRQFEVEQLYPHAPLLVIGQGTNQTQRIIIAKRLLERARTHGLVSPHPLPPSPLATCLLW